MGGNLPLVELHAARLMVYQAAWKNDHNQDIRTEAYMAKMFTDECPSA
jgi:alkylation response protein AidB-like acyl-CoA dehydrogenase